MREGARSEMLLAFESALHRKSVSPPQDEPTDVQKLEISVVFTSLRPTLRALRRAADLARRLRARKHGNIPTHAFPCFRKQESKAMI